MILSRGDITKRDEIAWSYTAKDAEPFIEYLKRDLMFREAVLAFLGAGDSRTKEEKLRDEYCKTCRRLKPGMDCSACSRKIEVQHGD